LILATGFGVTVIDTKAVADEDAEETGVFVEVDFDEQAAVNMFSAIATNIINVQLINRICFLFIVNSPFCERISAVGSRF
jgi:hypothetical protein